MMIKRNAATNMINEVTITEVSFACTAYKIFPGLPKAKLSIKGTGEMKNYDEIVKRYEIQGSDDSVCRICLFRMRYSQSQRLHYVEKRNP